MQNRAKNTFTVVLFALFVATGTVSADEGKLAVNDPVVPTILVSTNAVSAPIKATAADADPTKPVQILLFYEALCKDSVDFVAYQLKPTYEKYSKFIGITYNPFSQGKIDVVNNKTVYTCAREQAECDADRVHACAIAHISNQDDLLKFINCSLVDGFDNKVIPVETCGKKNNIDPEIINKIITCFNGSEGYTFLPGYKEKATADHVEYVPTIFINKVYSNETQKLAQENLEKVVCIHIPEANRPDECKKVISGSSTVMVGVLPIFIIVYYIIKMF